MTRKTEKLLAEALDDLALSLMTIWACAPDKESRRALADALAPASGKLRDVAEAIAFPEIWR